MGGEWRVRGNKLCEGKQLKLWKNMEIHGKHEIWSEGVILSAFIRREGSFSVLCCEKISKITVKRNSNRSMTASTRFLIYRLALTSQ